MTIPRSIVRRTDRKAPFGENAAQESDRSRRQVDASQERPGQQRLPQADAPPEQQIPDPGDDEDARRHGDRPDHVGGELRPPFGRRRSELINDPGDAEHSRRRRSSDPGEDQDSGHQGAGGEHLERRKIQPEDPGAKSDPAGADRAGHPRREHRQRAGCPSSGFPAAAAVHAPGPHEQDEQPPDRHRDDGVRRHESSS